MKKLPIGIQDFAEIIEGQCLYVDKTKAYIEAFQDGKYFFFSRPRRFGKSLMLSTLKYLYQGRKDLFKGLWIENNWDWEKVYPVIYIDLNKINTRTIKLTDGLNEQIASIADSYGIKLERKDYIGRFEELMARLSTPDRKCVILVDEYDKPITDYIQKPEIAEEHTKDLKGFYGQMKSADTYIHKVVVTGVSKYGKVAIFSDLNNLEDISLDAKAAKICGYTQEELETSFAEYLDKGTEQFKISKQELLDNIKYWYNGYTFDDLMSSKMYNPFSILNFFSKFQFHNFWFDTGTPTFLAEMIAEDKLNPTKLEYLKATDIMFKSADLRHIDALFLLFQTGYLTIKDITGTITKRIYTLGYPNQEVRQSFVTYLLAAYMQETPTFISSNFIAGIHTSLMDRDLDSFFATVNRIFASVPYHIFENTEAYYHSLVHVMLTLTDYLVLSELSTNKGRIDTVLETEDAVFIFEFKIDSSPEIALAQIHEKGYAERYGKADKELILIGVNFDSKERKITSYKCEA